MYPLEPPARWPPPEAPPPGEAELRWSRWPIIGILPRWFHRSRRYSHHLSNVLFPIEKEIVDQLVARSSEVVWASEHYAAVAQLISQAVAAEKGIEPPLIMPEDLFGLLFWGAYDDLTPLQFALAFEKKFRVEMTWPEMLQFYENGQTVGEFVDHCVSKIQTH
jgi:hypothetical protein